MKVSWLFFIPLALFVTPARADWVSGHFDDLRGSRDYALYVPKAPGLRPLLVFLHGCNETPNEFAAGARVAEFAEEYGYYVLLPRQDSRENSEGCWNWFVPRNQLRDSGEEGLLAALTDEVVARNSISRSRIYLAGLSAGGAMANLLASCHPDLFSGVAIHSGMPFRAASDPFTAFWSVAHGSPVAPLWAGTLAYQCSGVAHRRMPLFLIQGSEDQRVVPDNARQILEGFAVFNDWMDDGLNNGSVNLDRPQILTGQVPGGYAFTSSTFFEGGKALMKSVTVTGMAHAWSGGDPHFPRTDSKGPDATRLIFDFFEKESR